MAAFVEGLNASIFSSSGVGQPASLSPNADCRTLCVESEWLCRYGAGVVAEADADADVSGWWRAEVEPARVVSKANAEWGGGETSEEELLLFSEPVESSSSEDDAEDETVLGPAYEGANGRSPDMRWGSWIGIGVGRVAFGSDMAGVADADVDVDVDEAAAAAAGDLPCFLIRCPYSSSSSSSSNKSSSSSSRSASPSLDSS